MQEKKRVLLVDDDEDFRASTRLQLELNGYGVAEASSGKEALETLAEAKPDVILLDVMMESLEEGYRVSEAIRRRSEYQRYRATPIIMVSSGLERACEHYPIPTEAARLQPNRYLTKPIQLPILLEALEKVL
jgi:CheY-like chemotaxis protein